MIEILTNGAPNVIQDLGRPGTMALGVSRNGAMDTLAISLANALIGNEASAAAIEVCLFPFRARFETDTEFAVTGADCTVRLDGELVAPWWARSARAGQSLSIERPKHGARAYVALRGGIDVEPVLGSRSTDLKAGFGGLGGRGLRRGDTLKLNAVQSRDQRATDLGVVPRDVPALWQELASGCVTVRTLPAAEYGLFTSEARHAFEHADYEVTPDANRVGYRLAGPCLPLVAPVELLSHGIVPGTVQVPPSGQPIVQLADANTCGGYPKIATIIEADLWRLAQAPIGCRIRFSMTDIDSALSALRTQREEQAKLRRTLALMAQRG
ncbi:biotin-dependent carboxyltransferase family protein [Ralstonia insidiosa]|uniref:Allophanate hydrolase n=1 Tax=Ralstonia insidiosa TaxID=190721 RepID=A0A191ZW76_9RALS|nr:biotin-dependent carboxyltransferase family protein [Ralstonia insidiosa]ANJ72410.1 allophanate hydrolase [Ralstonia insidiosa]KAB0472956.1 biotin-dependent carboxyltransferase family protein [Ralstonia insidiosa]MBY4907413.1 biotin-dependent carboxyltransferase family protein [Ralstonia insidiosa]